MSQLSNRYVALYLEISAARENFSARFVPTYTSSGGTSGEEVCLAALVNAANRYQSGETPDFPQIDKSIFEAVHVKSNFIVEDNHIYVNDRSAQPS